MRGRDSTLSWLQELAGLLIISICAACPGAYAGVAYPSRSASTTDLITTNSSSDGEGDSEFLLRAELSEPPVLPDGAVVSSCGELQLMGRSVRDDSPFETGFAADVESTSLGDQPGGSDLLTTCRSPNSADRNKHGLPCLPSPGENVNLTEGAVFPSDSPTRRRPWWTKLWYRARDLCSRGRKSSGRLRTPFNLNRFVLLIAYTISTFLSSGCFYGWPSIRSILFNQGTYSDACTRSSNGTFLGDLRSNGTEYICNEQDALVQGLFSLGSAVSCVVAVFGGIAYERVGPRLSAVTGQLMNITGWALLAFSRAPAAAVAIIAAVLPLTSFPQYCVRHLFPGHEQAVVMVLSAALSASPAMPLLVVQAAKSVGTIRAVWGFILMALVPSLFVAIFLIPCRDFLESMTSGVGGCDDGVSSARENFVSRPQDTRVPSLAHRRSSRLQRACHMLRHMFPWEIFVSRSFALILVYRTVIVLTTGYYFQSSMRMLPTPVVNTLGRVILSTPLFGLLFGLATYLVTPANLMVVTSVAGLLSYVLPLVHNSDVCGYLSMLSFSMYLGTALPQTLAYLAVITGERYFAPLAGVLVMVSGLLGSLSAPLYTKVTIKLLQGEPRVVQFACIVALVLQFLWLFFIRRREARITQNVLRPRLAGTASHATFPQDGDRDLQDNTAD